MERREAVTLGYGRRTLSRKRLVVWALVLTFVMPVPALLYRRFAGPVSQHVRLLIAESRLPGHMVDMRLTDPKAQADRDAVKRYMDQISLLRSSIYLPATIEKNQGVVVFVDDVFSGRVFRTLVRPRSTLFQSSNDLRAHVFVHEGAVKLLGAGPHPTKPSWIQFDVTIDGKPATIDAKVGPTRVEYDSPVFLPSPAKRQVQ